MVGVQIGLGPSPPPEPLVINSTVPKTNRPSTITVVVAIQPTCTPRWPRAWGPPTGSGTPLREARHMMRVGQVDPHGDEHRQGDEEQDVEVELVVRRCRGHGPRRHVGSDQDVEQHVEPRPR
jgi:hypothetical protein